jgi:hypothetical protein
MAFCTVRLAAPNSRINTACVGNASPDFSPPERIRSRSASAITSNVNCTPLPAGLRPRRPTTTPVTSALHALYQQNPARPNRETGPYPRPTTRKKGIRRDALECACGAMLTSRTRW